MSHGLCGVGAMPVRAGGGREGPVPGYRGHVVMWSCDLVLS